ncbi:MAG: (4Fe-4S)-binding protein, partial [Candidatus Krumholzibacteria bacterium]|nr:(4Fe-4S)-binding protein [Candidatus Krumholzibacteria bacterium]
YFCPSDAIAFEEEENGFWYVSRTRFGPMVHARLHAGSENSGKLVTLVRNEAKRIAQEKGIDLVLIDGSPGIGCPVIASITGAGFVLIVTEPTRSGVHDMERVMKLTQHFGINTMVAINKYDINKKISSSIEEAAEREGAVFAGMIGYDTAITEAQIKGKTIVEVSGSQTADEIKGIWNKIRFHMSGGGKHK